MARLVHRKNLAYLFSCALWVPTLGNAQEQVCELPWQPGEIIAEISDDAIDESSGLAHSWLHDDRLWTHNDSGDEARLWAMQKNGVVTTEIRLIGAENTDWEDMAIAPCGADDDRPCIYIGDFGDNLARREEVLLYRFPEPDLGDAPPETLDLTEFETLRYQYEGGPRDAETLLVHPQTRQIWVIEKTGASEVAVFSIPEIFGQQEAHIAHSIATLEIPGSLALARNITAGEIAPDGSEFTFRTYVSIFTHCVSDPDDFESAFSTTASRVTMNPATIQGEALTYDRDDGALWLTSERLPAPLIRLPPRNEEAEEEESPPEDAGDIADPEPRDSGPTQTDTSPSGSNDDLSGCTCSSARSPVNTSTLLPLVLLLSALVVIRHRTL